MPLDMMRGLMGHDECQLVNIARDCDKRDRECDDGPSGIVTGLKCVGRRALAVIHHDPKIAIQLRRPFAACCLYDRFNGFNDLDEITDRHSPAKGWRSEVGHIDGRHGGAAGKSGTKDIGGKSHR